MNLSAAPLHLRNTAPLGEVCLIDGVHAALDGIAEHSPRQAERDDIPAAEERNDNNAPLDLEFRGGIDPHGNHNFSLRSLRDEADPTASPKDCRVWLTLDSQQLAGAAA